MKKYYRFALVPLYELLIKRLTILLWRVRVIISTVTLFLLWDSVLTNDATISGYTQSMMLTYILIGSFISTITIGSRSFILGDIINSGDLSNYLLKPVNYFLSFFMDDIGAKILDSGMSILELTVLYLILRPDILVQTNPISIFFFFLATLLGMSIYFFLGVILSSIAFWSSEVWAPKFLFSTLTVFLSGTIFPLDILPSAMYTLLMLSPFPYLLFFPIKIYLGQVNVIEIAVGFSIACLWLGILSVLSKNIWQKGLKMYGASGR